MSDLVYLARKKQGRAGYWKPITLQKQVIKEYWDFWPPLSQRKIRCCQRQDLEDELEELGCSLDSIGRNTSWVRLLDLINRKRRGLLLYEDCTYEELLMSCAQRRVPRNTSSKRAEVLVIHTLAYHPHASQLSRKQLIRALERADEHPSFDCFSELPTELRLLVYAFSFEYFDKPPMPCPSPPVAQISCLRRSETLPLFYEDKRLRLQLEIEGHNENVAYESATASFIQTCLPLAAKFRTILIEVDWYDRPGYVVDYNVFQGLWIIDFDKKGKGHQVCRLEEFEEPWAGLERIFDRLEESLCEFFGWVAERVDKEAPIEMSQADWNYLAGIFEEGNNEVRRLHEMRVQAS